MKTAFIHCYFLLLISTVFAIPTHAAEYVIDTKGAHASIQFRIKHLGYSWLTGRFNTFDGQFSWDDKKPETSSIKVTIDTSSIDSNHAERDKHLRSKDFLDTRKFPVAAFISTGIITTDKINQYKLTGNLTLHGVTKPISFMIHKVGEGKDPWGGYRVGFEGSTTLKLEDFGIKNTLGPASASVEMVFNIEGIRQ